MLIIDKHCSDVCCDKFPMPQIDRKSKQVKNSDMENFYLQSVQRKTRHIKHQKFKSRSREPGSDPSWPNFPTIRIGPLAVNPHTKFDVSIFSRSLDIEGVPKFKSRSRDVGHAPYDPKM